MVQHNYIHRLALGRSAFEAPISRPADPQPAERDQGEAPCAQHYDERGHPVNASSRSAARRLRRAQNDVLSTIGITLPTNGVPRGAVPADAIAADGRQHELEDSEGWTSLGLSLTFEALLSATTTAIHNQRIRLQTFAKYAGVPISHAIATEARHQGILSYFFAGEPEFWASHMIDVVSKLATMSLTVSLEGVWIRCLGERTAVNARKASVRRLEQALTLGTSIALCPFYALVTLQRLQLIPPTPFLIWPWQYSLKLAFLTLLPQVPASWSVITALRFIGEFPSSPLGLSLLTEVVITGLRDILTRYSRAALPRPDNPERKAVTDASTDSESKWPLHEYPQLQPSFKDELATDLRRIGSLAGYYWYHLKNLLVPAVVRQHRARMLDTFRAARLEANLQDDSMRLFSDVQELIQSFSDENREQFDRRIDRIEQTLAALRARARNAPENDAARERIRTAEELVTSVREEMANLRIDRAQQAAEESRYDSLDEVFIRPSTSDSYTDRVIAELQQQQQQQNSSAPSSNLPARAPAPSMVESSPGTSPALEPTNVQVRTRSGSTSTLHMDVEINPAAAGEPFMTSFSASPRSAQIETSISQVIHDDGRGKPPHHRVNELSLLPTDLLSQCMLRIAVQACILPIQSYQCRNLARRFLLAADPASANQVYSPSSWFGLGLRAGGGSNAADYATKLILCLGAEMVLGLGSWLVVSGASSFIGRSWFSWGKF